MEKLDLNVFIYTGLHHADPSLLAYAISGEINFQTLTCFEKLF